MNQSSPPESQGLPVDSPESRRRWNPDRSLIDYTQIENFVGAYEFTNSAGQIQVTADSNSATFALAGSSIADTFMVLGDVIDEDLGSYAILIDQDYSYIRQIVFADFDNPGSARVVTDIQQTPNGTKHWLELKPGGVYEVASPTGKCPIYMASHNLQDGQTIKLRYECQLAPIVTP